MISVGKKSLDAKSLKATALATQLVDLLTVK